MAFTLEITSDEGSWTDQFIVHIFRDPTSTSSLPDDTELSLYPNPTKGSLYLKPGIEIDSQSEIRIMDSTGRLVYEQKFSSLIIDDILKIDLSDYQSGLYLLQFNHSGVSRTQKIILNH